MMVRMVSLGNFFRGVLLAGMAEENHLSDVWNIIERTGVCMLTTRSAAGLRARPMEARPDRDRGLIWFLTNLNSSKERQIESESEVGLVFIDASDKAYLSITARSEVHRDSAKAAEIWKATDYVWWNGPDDPEVCLLRVAPLRAELWDGPASGALTALISVKSLLTGQKPNLGENRKVTLKM